MDTGCHKQPLGYKGEGMNRLNSLWVTAAAALIVVGCGGGGGGSDNKSSSNSSTPEPVVFATVAVAVEDSSTEESDGLLDNFLDDDDVAPFTATASSVEDEPTDCDGTDNDHPDCDDDDQLLINVVRVVLLGEDGPEEIFEDEDEGEEIDLFDLKDGVELKFLDNKVKPGVYEKIRLIVDGDPRLINDEYPEGTDVKLPSGKVDLNPRGEFRILPGDSVVITVDWHAKKSIKYMAGPNLILRPVVFVDIDLEARERIVRVTGIVGEVGPADADPKEFELCRAVFVQPVIDVDDDDCIDIIVTDMTGLFDENGEPQGFEGIKTDDPVTVIGLLREADDEIDECDEAAIPEDDCTIVEPLQVTASSYNDDKDDDNDERRLEIIAAVVEEGLPGTWERFRGTIETTPDGLDEFDFRLAGPEGRLLQGKLYEESRIFVLDEEDGIMEIEIIDLMAGDRAIVEAVFVPGDDLGPTPKGTPDDCSEASIPEECQEVPEKLDGTLRISLMLVSLSDDGTPPEETPDVVGGKLLSVDTTTGRLDVATAEGDRCIDTDAETDILLIFVDGDEVKAIEATLEELEEGSLILASGTQNGCLDADIVVSEGEAKIDPVPTP